MHSHTGIKNGESGKGKVFRMEWEYPADFKQVIAFHGHVCPGLASGYRMAKAALAGLGMTSPDEGDLVTIAETDRCTIDAFQVILGCTLGKGKMVVRSTGKQAFIVGCRKQNKAVRVVTRAEAFQYTPEEDALAKKVMSGQGTQQEYDTYKTAQARRIKELLTQAEETLFRVYPVAVALPGKEMIFYSPCCQTCGEQVMEPWVRMREGKYICLTCLEGNNK